jgi:outer membrane lipoprotein-sorting protein
MKNRIFTSLIFVLIICTAISQSSNNGSEKSKEILEKVSTSYQSKKTIKFNFELTILSEDINENQSGYALLENDKFYYKTEEREVISDGKTVWTYIPEDNECYIDLLEDLENSINPNEIFTIWKEGFKFQYMKKSMVNNEGIHEIKMFPENPSESKYHTLIMEVNENQATIEQATIKSKDGVTIKFKILELVANPKLDSDTFYWNKDNYPNIDEIDNR